MQWQKSDEVEESIPIAFVETVSETELDSMLQKYNLLLSQSEKAQLCIACPELEYAFTLH